MATESLATLAAALADGSVRVVDLTQPLSETTPVLQLPPPFANTPGAEPRGDQPLRRPRARLGVEHADRRRARRHPLRRPDPLDHGPRRRGRRQRAAGEARRARRGDRQVRRGGRGPELPAHARRHPGVGVRARAAAPGRLAAAADRLGRPSARPGQLPERRADAGPRRRGRALARRGLADRGRRRRDRRHRRGRRALLRAALPGPPLPPGGGQVRAHPAREPRRAAADRRDRRGRAAEARGRDGVAVAGVRARRRGWLTLPCIWGERSHPRTDAPIGGSSVVRPIVVVACAPHVRIQRDRHAGLASASSWS